MDFEPKYFCNDSSGDFNAQIGSIETLEYWEDGFHGAPAKNLDSMRNCGLKLLNFIENL